MLAAKASGVLKAKQLEENITVDVGRNGETQTLIVAVKDDWVLWDTEKGFRCFFENIDFREKWLVLGGD